MRSVTARCLSLMLVIVLSLTLPPGALARYLANDEGPQRGTHLFNPTEAIVRVAEPMPIQPTPLKVSLTKSIFSRGEQVSAVVETTGQVLITSDLSRSSFQQDVVGSKTISLGPVNEDGYFAVHFQVDTTQQVLQLLFLKTSSQFELLNLAVPVKMADVGPAAQLITAMEKFLKNINASRVARAYSTAKTKFPKENAIALGNTVLICLITIPIGTWLVCATTVGGQVVDFAFKLNEELIDVMGPTKDKVLSAEEAALLKKWTGVSKTLPDAVNIIFGSGKGDKFFAALKVGTGVGEAIVENEDGKFVFKTTGDFIKKYEVIYSLKSKP